MSKDAVIEFLKKVDQIPGLQEKLEKALDDEKAAVASFLDVATEQGFQFTADEFLEAVQAEGSDDTSGELSDEDLEAVAGGLSFGSPRMRSMTGRATRILGGLRGGPGIRGIGLGGVAQDIEEEELQT